MPKRSRRPSEADDVNVTAFRVVQEAINGSSPKRKKRKNPMAVALGRRGGKIGGKRRAELLTGEQRREIASRAASARWARRAENPESQ